MRYPAASKAARRHCTLGEGAPLECKQAPEPSSGNFLHVSSPPPRCLQPDHLLLAHRPFRLRARARLHIAVICLALLACYAATLAGRIKQYRSGARDGFLGCATPLAQLDCPIPSLQVAPSGEGPAATAYAVGFFVGWPAEHPGACKARCALAVEREAHARLGRTLVPCLCSHFLWSHVHLHGLVLVLGMASPA